MTPINDNIAYVPYPADRAALYRESACWIGQTHSDFLKVACQKFGHHIAVREGDKSLSYHELYDLVVTCGSFLKSQGLEKKDIVILQSSNVIEYIVILFAIYYIGARPLFCLDAHGAYEIENMAKTSGASGYIRIIESQSNKEDVIDITNKFALPNFKLWFRKTFISNQNLQSFVDLIQDYPIIEAESVDSEEVAFIQLSGGTTGQPKLIPRTHDDYLYSVRLSAEVAHLDALSRQLIVLPISHNFTMSSPGFLGALYVGASIILAENASPEICFPLIEKYRINQVSVVPSLIINWINSCLLDDYDLSSLKVIQIGGSKLLPEVAEKIVSQLGAKIQQVYGMAEGLVNFTHLDDNLNTIIHTQGKKLSPLDEILIIDDFGNILPNGSEGHILTRGPYTINGYYNLAEKNEIHFTKDGFYKTGDIGYIDNQENIVITGRAKDQINKAGEKIAPSEIENLIFTHPAVRDVSVLGMPDKFYGERIKAYIILNDEHHQLSLQDIRAFLMQKNLAIYKLPDEIELVKTFQYTPIGKINKQSKAI